MAKMEDNLKHKGLRKQLVKEIEKRGIISEEVLNAIGNVPRHWFLDTVFINSAYEDKAFPIAAGQTISQPYTVAYQTSLLQINKGDKILEIGTGSGYQTCVLLEMDAKVFSIERQKELHDKAKKFLPTIGYNPKLFYGDGYKGLPTYAPFDKIIVTAGAPYIPEDLISQLKPGGILVIPVGSGLIQIMTIILKTSETDFEKIELDQFKFVPLLEDKAK
jgi:protein-L-isoaspartate(D-aspartate) O-methyltransferase